MKFLLGKLQVLLKWFGTSILAALGLSFVTYTGVSKATYKTVSAAYLPMLTPS